MAIWFKDTDEKEASKLRKDTLMETLDIKITEVGDDYIKGTMPVDHRTAQAHGVLHGGASLALAESLGSVAAQLTVDTDKFYCAGMEINANHLRPVTNGSVTGTASPIHLGRTSQVWNIEIRNNEDKLICISRITMAIVVKEQ